MPVPIKHADALAVVLVDGEAGICYRLPGGHDGILNEAVAAVGQLAVHGDERIELLDLGGESRVKAGRVEARDRSQTGCSGQNRAPGFRDIEPDR